MNGLRLAEIPALLGALAASGLSPLERLAALLRQGIGPPAALASVLAGLPGLPERAELLAESLRHGVEDQTVASACRAHGVHPVSVAAQFLDAEVDLDSARSFGCTPQEVQWLAEAHGGIRILAPGLRTLPGGLTSPLGIWIEGQGDLRRLTPFPQAPLVTLEALAITRLDLSRERVEDLIIRRCSRLREIVLPASGSVRILQCPALQRVRVKGPIRDKLEVLSCPSLRTLRLDAALQGDLHLAGLPALERVRGMVSVAGQARLEDLGSLRSLPPGMHVGGAFSGHRLTSLARIGTPAGPMESFRLFGPSRLTALPSGLIILKAMVLIDQPCLRAIPGDLKVGTGLRIERCAALARFGKGFQPPASLTLRACGALRRLPHRETPYEALELRDLPLLKDPLGGDAYLMEG